MKDVPLQLVTVCLENGRQGIFIGVPLITEEYVDDNCQVEEVWFSDVQQIPEHLPLAKLLRLVALQVSRTSAVLQ